MPDKYKNKYRISTTRLPEWNYGWNAAYFVTICTNDRKCYFGQILNGEMDLSPIGQIAHKYWLDIPKHFPFVILDEFVVMPNHVHGIIIINKTDDERAAETQMEPQVATPVETQDFASLQTIPTPKYKNKFGPQSKNLASIIRGCKSGVKKYATLNHINFAWQPRFFEHIIRNDQSLEKIRTYISENPAKWSHDEYFQQV